MSFLFNWVSSSDILKKLLQIEKIMSNTQEKIDALTNQVNKAKQEVLVEIAALQARIDAGETIDLTALTAAIQGIDDINQDAPEVLEAAE